MKTTPRRARATAAATALALSGLALSGAAIGPPAGAASPAEPSLELWGPARATAYAYGTDVYLEPMFRVVAGDPVEVRAHRPGYDEPIRAELVAPGGTVPLPADAMSDFSGLTDFLTVTVVKVSTGREMTSWTQDACLNGDSQRTRPDAPASSPYPYGCPSNPYTVGSVMGVQAGHSAELASYGTQYDGLQLRPGKYDLTATVRPELAALFHMTTTSVTTRLTVARDSCTRCLRSVQGTAATEDVSPPAHVHAPRGAVGGITDGPRPDLEALPPWQLALNRKGTVLRFAATVWNGGPSPMVVEGFRDATDEDTLDAYQYFFDQDGNQVGYQQVGHMHWHAGNHNHWHFEDFARYELLDADLNPVVPSTKNSFCLANTDAVDYTVPGADWKPGGTDLSSACGGRSALSVREALSSGSGDTYYQYRTGQAFRIKDLPDGVYHLRITANPDGNLLEERTDNNTAMRRLKLRTDKYGMRTLKVSKVGIIDEESTRDYYRTSFFT